MAEKLKKATTSRFKLTDEIKQRVIDIHLADPNLGIKEIADIVGCGSWVIGKVTTEYWKNKMKEHRICQKEFTNN